MGKRLLAPLLFVYLLGSSRLSGQVAPPQWVVGDVFVAVGNGQYQVYHNSGTALAPNYILVETLNQGLATSGPGGITNGCVFDSTFNLYTTNQSNTEVVKFDGNSSHDVLQVVDANATDPEGGSESVVFDASGNFYVGDLDGDQFLLKYNPAATTVTTFMPAIENLGPSWIDLSTDGKTLFYTSEGLLVKRFDVSTGAQLSDFAALCSPLTSLTGCEGETGFALRLLPPGDGSGGLLVADGLNIKRLNSSGSVIQTYPNPGSGAANSELSWFGLNLDPNGTSF